MSNELIVAPFEGEDVLQVVVPEQSIKITAQPIFNQILEAIPQVIAEGRALLETYDPATIDEDDLSQVIAQINDIRKFNNNIDDSLKKLRRVFDQAKLNTQQIVTERLDEAGFDQLMDLAEQLNRFKKEVQAYRKKSRWEEIESYYNETLQAFEALIKHLPRQSSFDAFYKAHESNSQYVTGAKNWLFNDKRKALVNEHINQLHNDLNVLLSLKSPYEEELLERYENQPILADVVQFNQKLMEQEAQRIKMIEEKAKREAEEKVRLEMEAEKAKLLQQEKARQKVEALKRPQETMVQANLSDSPFGVASPDQKCQRVLTALGLTQQLEAYQSKELSQLATMTAMYQYLQAIFTKNKEVQSITASPKEVLDTLQLLLNATKGTD